MPSLLARTVNRYICKQIETTRAEERRSMKNLLVLGYSVPIETGNRPVEQPYEWLPHHRNSQVSDRYQSNYSNRNLRSTRKQTVEEKIRIRENHLLSTLVGVHRKFRCKDLLAFLLWPRRRDDRFGSDDRFTLTDQDFSIGGKSYSNPFQLFPCICSRTVGMENRVFVKHSHS